MWALGGRAKGSLTAPWVWLVVFIWIALVTVAQYGLLLQGYERDPGIIVTPDSSSYYEPAKIFLETGEFGTSKAHPNWPMIVRTPGYPTFIAAVYLLFGKCLFKVASAQLVLAGLILLMTYATTATLWGRREGLVALIGYSLSAVAWVHTSALLSEALFTFFLILAILSGVHVLRESPAKVWFSLLMGVALAAATLTRPITYYLPICLLVGLLIVAVRRRWSIGTAIAVAVLSVLPSVVACGLWQWRNHVLTGSAEFSHIKGINLLFYRGAGVQAQLEDVPFKQVSTRFRDEYGYVSDLAMPVDQLEGFGRAGMAMIREHPLLVIKDQIRGLGRTLFRPCLTGLVLHLGLIKHEETLPSDEARLPAAAKNWIRKPVVILVLGFASAWLLLMHLGFVAGSYRAASQRWPDWPVHVFIWGIATYQLVIGAGPETVSRFRYPVEPLLWIYASAGLTMLYDRFVSRQSRSTSDQAAASND